MPDRVPTIELAIPGLQLNLTAQPWALRAGESQMILGRDVIHPDRIAPDGGRRPVACSIDAADLPLTSVIEVACDGRVPVRFHATFAGVGAAPFTKGANTLRRNDGEGWPAEMEGAIMAVAPVYQDPATTDQGRYLWEMRQITGISTSAVDNDTLEFDLDFSFTLGAQHKLWCDYQVTVNRNGILVSNGRKFWLLQGGTYYQVMDLGSNDYLGERWRGSMIALDRVMLTNDKRPPRMFYFRDALPNAATADVASYAGLGTPVKPPFKEPDYTEPPVAGNNASWRGSALGGGNGSLAAGNYRIMVRAVNLVDGGQSRLVRVWKYADNTTDLIAAAATDAIKLQTNLGAGGNAACPYDSKWTHLEIWRTEADGAEFFLEGRVPIVDFANEYRDSHVVAGNNGRNCLLGGSTYYDAEASISDADLNRRTSLAVNDLLAGYRPPVCKEAVNLQGVTVCAGKAASDADPFVEQYAYMVHCHTLGTTYTHGTRRIAFAAGAAVFGGYVDYTVGDEFVITYSAELVTGAYPIASKVDPATLELSAPGPGQDLTAVTGYIRRTYRIESQKIASDEDVWYSRTDQYAPESFMLRTLNLSRSGDKFMGLRAVGRYAAVVMADAVHLLYLTTDVLGAIVLEKHTVAANGAGTPWPDSIATWERNVIWATPRGPMLMRVSDDADDQGMRAQITPLDQNGAMRQWFEDAHRLGYDIDAGVDTHHGCLRFRRHVDANTFEVVQFSYRTGLWTMLDDDSGLLYARSKYADDTEVVDPLLYSVNADGSAFEENYYGLTHPYDTKTVQAVTSVAGGYTVTTTSISKHNAFAAAMLGDIVRFRSATAAVDGVCRIITAATTDAITFATVTGLAVGDEFIIGATRFRLRASPIRGDRFVKTLDGMRACARPGLRATSGNWGVPSGTPLTLRSYRNHDFSEAMNEQDREIAVYAESDVTKTDQDRVSRLQAQGFAFQVELECIEARTDFLVESLGADVREEGATLGDASTTA